MKRLLERIRERFQSLPPSQRLPLLAVVTAIILALGFLFYVQGQTDYGVLFTNLSQEDAGAIIAKLKGKKVPYQLDNNGTAILVPKSEMYELRLLLASEGLPKGGGVGFEIFDNSDIGMTEYAQKINYQRALQGELARTIMSLRQVKHARVHLVLPETSIFKQKAAQPKASVSLIVKPGAQFTPDHINGIQRLIAAG